MVLVVDFGAQYAQLIARRVREARVYSEIVPSTMPVAEMLAKNPRAIILSGGPSSVYAEGAPSLDRSLFKAGVPVFGMCYGFQLMATTLGGTVDDNGAREYGRTPLHVTKAGSTLFEGTPTEQPVWMSHGDACSAAPEGFTVTASTDVVPVAAFENDEKKLYGVQYHPEVMHSTHGQQVLEHFLYRGAGIEPNWTTTNVVEEQVALIREQVGDKRAICGLSGGVDSAVAAALVQKAIGSQLTCVYVDHGLMRKGETEQVEKDFVAATGAKLKVVDAEKRFLDALAGVSDPEQKRKIIGREFIRVFEQAQLEILQEEGPEVAFLVQGTLYPDVVESGGGTGTANIKSHHNVGGLPDDIEFQLVEPLPPVVQGRGPHGRPGARPSPRRSPSPAGPRGTAERRRRKPCAGPCSAPRHLAVRRRRCAWSGCTPRGPGLLRPGPGRRGRSHGTRPASSCRRRRPGEGPAPGPGSRRAIGARPPGPRRPWPSGRRRMSAGGREGRVPGPAPWAPPLCRNSEMAAGNSEDNEATEIRGGARCEEFGRRAHRPGGPPVPQSSGAKELPCGAAYGSTGGWWDWLRSELLAAPVRRSWGIFPWWRGACSPWSGCWPGGISSAVRRIPGAPVLRGRTAPLTRPRPSGCSSSSPSICTRHSSARPGVPVTEASRGPT
ncbi:Carbamoyl-phosphate synthase small chain [Streptomyces badius]